MKKRLMIIMVVVSMMYTSCTPKTPKQYYEKIVSDKNVFVHIPMTTDVIFEDTNQYAHYLRIMSAPFFGDNCDYFMQFSGMGFICIDADTILTPSQIRTQLAFASGDTLYRCVAEGISDFAIETGMEGNSIHVILPRPEQLHSWNIWKLLCMHEAVHVKNYREGENKNTLEREISAYLAEKDVLQAMNPDWYNHFRSSFVPFYKDHGFCPEMLSAIDVVFQSDSLSLIEQSTMPGALLIFIAMEAKGVDEGDTKEMNDILIELNKFFSSQGAVKYY